MYRYFRSVQIFFHNDLIAGVFVNAVDDNRPQCRLRFRQCLAYVDSFPECKSACLYDDGDAALLHIRGRRRV